MPKIHYAVKKDTVCGVYIVSTIVRSKIIQHTTIKDKVTCKKCLKLINKKVSK